MKKKCLLEAMNNQMEWIEGGMGKLIEDIDDKHLYKYYQEWKTARKELVFMIENELYQNNSYQGEI